MAVLVAIFICLMLGLSPSVLCRKTLKVTLSPTQVSNLPQGSTATVVIHASTTNSRLKYIYVEGTQPEVALVTGNSRFPISPETCDDSMKVDIVSGGEQSRVGGFVSSKDVKSNNNSSNNVVRSYQCFNATFQVKGVLLGRTVLALYVGEQSRKTPDTISDLIYDNYPVSVIRTHSHINVILHWSLIGMVILTVFCVSTKVDFTDIKQIVKKPNGACMTFALMFIFKPLFSYALGTVFTIDKALRLGVFALGSCPEGAVSLIWTHILGGDIALAIIISCGEAILSFGAIPLSMVSLGQSILGWNTPIPFPSITLNSAEVLVACTSGVLVRCWAPEVVSIKLGRIARFLGTFTLLFLIFVNIYCYRDVLPVMGQWRVLACGTLLPGLGGLLGGVVAWASCQNWKTVKSISLAVILQGIDVPLAIINTSLPTVDAQLAGLVPVIAALFANFALWPPCLLRYFKDGCGIQDDVIIHTTNTTMSMKKKKFRAMFALTSGMELEISGV